jgi:hypothetical protein
LKNIDDKQQQDDINIAIQKFRQLQYTDPKQVHKKLFKNNDRFNLDCIQEPLTGELHTDNNKTNELIQQYFTELLCPLTTDVIDNIPASWENDTAVPFKSKLPLIHNDEVKQLMYDPIVFQDCIMSLSNNKAPGPDGLLNELLKFAPYCVKCIIHDFFKLIYTCTFTPTAWKKSETVLLYKKNDPTLIKNYRPIALANTIYKLYTRVLTYSLGTICETHNILSYNQEGFRQGKNTIRQLHNLLTVIEDAAISKKDLYMLYVDFSNAFNMMSHSRLLHILEMLGVPEHTIKVIKQLYTNQFTTIKTLYNKTDIIEIKRGTIQGDTLSPLLFICAAFTRLLFKRLIAIFRDA